MAKLDAEDLNAIQGLIKVTIDEAIEEKGLVTKEDIGHLPTKDEFYTKTDEVMGELKPSGKSGPHKVINSRITKIELQK